LSEPPSFWRAGPTDQWIRHLIEGRGATLDRSNTPHRVREKHLQNKFKTVPGKPWAQELSGRALSLARDVRQKAQNEAQKLSDQGGRKFEFHHVAHSPVNRLAGHGNLGVFIVTGAKPRATAIDGGAICGVG
jgi:hypothetical protein